MLPNLVKYYIKIHYNNRFASPRHNSGSPPNDQVVPREILSHEPSTLLSHRAFSVLLTSSLSEDKFIRVDSGNILLNQLRTKHEAWWNGCEREISFRLTAAKKLYHRTYMSIPIDYIATTAPPRAMTNAINQTATTLLEPIEWVCCAVPVDADLVPVGVVLPVADAPLPAEVAAALSVATGLAKAVDASPKPTVERLAKSLKFPFWQ